jgi:hypothetical protein
MEVYLNIIYWRIHRPLLLNNSFFILNLNLPFLDLVLNFNLRVRIIYLLSIISPNIRINEFFKLKAMIMAFKPSSNFVFWLAVPPQKLIINIISLLGETSIDQVQHDQ